MHPSPERRLSLARTVRFACASLFSLSAATSLADPSNIEPGLERAVHWKWNVQPGNSEWGIPLPEAGAPGSPEAEAAIEAALRPATYEVKKGDAIVKIARKYNMTSAQLMQFNDLKSDLIQIGQILRIPTVEEVISMAPPSPPPAPKGKAKTTGNADQPTGRPGLELPPTTVAELELETVLVQVFLDREMFSQGAIDGDSGPMFEKMIRTYQQAHPDVADFDQLKENALAAVGHPYTSYALRAEDFRFIKPRKNEPVKTHASKPPRARKKGAKEPPPPAPSVTYEELVAAEFLAYTSVWEFVAERFHCDEVFLRRINPHIDQAPIIGTTFQVPNVIPFEIENALEPPLQPAADPLKPVTAAVVGLSMLEITRSGQLIAVMPLASARPGLRGRGSWTVLDAIPQPRLVTHHEPREAPAAQTEDPQKPGETLASGPNNPIGIIWINLTKSRSAEPLPYGLHGTSIPARMKQEGIGGLRLANWDIVRAVRLMPRGTPLKWRAK